MDRTEKIEAIHADLVKLHGKPEQRNPKDGTEQLVATILSQNVADTNTERAMSRLLAEYGHNYGEIVDAPIDELAETIRPAGFQETKADRIQRSLETIREHSGDYSLEFLDEYSTEEARNWLQDINGIGPKTANVVLSFHFGKPAMPVDTHVRRLSERFELVPTDLSNQKIHDILNDETPDDIKYEFHMLMIEHGRQFCTAQSPNCENEVCQKYCACPTCAE